MRLLKSNPSGRLFLVSLMVIMACLLIPGAFASATADQIKDTGFSGDNHPYANFSVNVTGIITAGDTVKFFDNSTKNITSWSWDFGDGSAPATTQNPTHTYANAGTDLVSYTVKLTVNNATGWASNQSLDLMDSGYVIPRIYVAPVSGVTPEFNVTVPGQPSTFEWSQLASDGNPLNTATPVVNVGDVLSFKDKSTPLPQAWSWNFGDPTSADNTAITQNATHAYSKPGVYYVYLSAGNVNGMVQSKIIAINVSTPISAVSNFTATDAAGNMKYATLLPSGSEISTTYPGESDNVLSGTAPTTINFADFSSKSPSVWNWNFTYNIYSGNVSKKQNPDPVTFTKAGNYLVVLNVTNPQSTVNSTSYLWVHLDGAQTPIADFNVTPSASGRSPFNVTFYDKSVGINTTSTAAEKLHKPDTYLWNFGDGTTDTHQNATHIFNNSDVYNPKTYHVTLQTWNGAGVSNLASHDVIVSPGASPSASFIVINGSDPNHYSNGNGGMIWVPAIVGSPITFTDISAEEAIDHPDWGYGVPTSMTWAFSDGQAGEPVAGDLNSVNRTFTKAGTYVVYHTAKNTAGQNSRYNIFVVSESDANVPVSNFNVTRETVDGITTHPYYWYSNFEAPVTLLFNSTSTNKPTSFQWMIDGQVQTETSANLTHSFTAPGVYSVALIASNAKGPSTYAAVGTINIQTVSSAPSAEFTNSSKSYAAPSDVQFTYDLRGTATSWRWDFDDGTFSNETNPLHKFDKAGTYSVTLTATNAKGSAVVKHDVTITPLTTPRASFNVTLDKKTQTVYYGDDSHFVNGSAIQVAGRSPLNVTFSDNSTMKPSAFYWDFGDGSTGSGSIVNHTYTTPGTYAVYLVVSNDLGLSDYVYSSGLIKVTSPVPVADFTASKISGAAPLTVQFTDKSTNNPSAWIWNFDDKTNTTISGSQNPVYTFKNPGVYNVSLIARNTVGPSATPRYMNISVLAISAPVNSFTANVTSGSSPLTVHFYDNSTNAPTSWNWVFFEDGVSTTSTEQNPVHNFTHVGLSFVTLIASNEAGSSTLPASGMITVTEPVVTPTVTPVVEPVAAFTANTTTGAAPLAVQFTDKSTNADQWVWNFDDEGVSELQNPTHIFQTAGTYTVQLQAVNSTTGKTNTKSMPITVTAAPSTLQAAFTVNAESVQLGQAVTGTDASTGYPAAYSWDFGDGFTASSQNINHIYSAVGSYNLSLTVTNGTQTSMASKTITVTAVPTTPTVAPGLPYNGPHNAPGTVQAEDYDLGGNTVAYADTTSGNAGGAYRTDDVDIEAVAGGYAVAYVISGEYLTYAVDAAAAGDYTIALKAANPDAAAKTVTVSTGSSSTTVSVSSTGSFNTFNTFTSAGTLSLAAGRNVVKVAFGASRMNLDYITIGAGVQPTSTVTTQPTSTVTTQPTTGAASFTVSPTSGKKSLTVALTDTTTGGNPVSYKWTCGNGQTFTGKSVGLNRIWYNNAGTYTITLTVTDANGSTRTATKTVTVTN